MPDRLDQVLDHLETTPLTTGHGFTEGPVWHPDGYFLFTTDPYVYRLDLDSNELTVVRESPAGSNGMTLDLDGRLVMCDGLHRSVTRMEPDGTIVPVAASCGGRPLNRPNDVVFRSDGTMYFTDPGAWPNHTPGASLFENFVFGVTPDGVVFEAAPVRVSQRPRILPDEGTLYVSNTRHHKHISAYDVRSDGTLANRRVFAELSQQGEPGVPDGMKVDVEGRTYCTGPGGVWVHGPEGDYIGKIRLPELPANLGWGDADNKTLYVTARTSVYRMRMKVEGTRMPRV